MQRRRAVGEPSHAVAEPSHAVAKRIQAVVELSRRRDLVVVGASAGGVEALTDLVRNLPGDLAAAVLVVLHLPPTSSSRLSEVLDRAGPIHAVTPAHGDVAEHGRIYVAPPDRHMIVSGRRIFLLDGPRENGVRPAVDPLFRSAAATAGERVVGIILSGTLDDGAAGMAAIQAFGGATIVQDPADALSDGMPRAVLELIRPDAVAPAAAMGPIVARLVDGELTERERRVQAGEAPDEPSAQPEDRAVAAAGHRAALVADPTTLPPSLTDLVCPDCGGSLAEVAVGPISRFRCRVGHVYSPEALFGMKSTELEAGLWAALRTLEESASVAKRLADRSRANGSTTMTRASSSARATPRSGRTSCDRRSRASPSWPRSGSRARRSRRPHRRTPRPGGPRRRADLGLIPGRGRMTRRSPPPRVTASGGPSVSGGSINTTAARATLHCLTGCAIGEVLGLVISTLAGLAILPSIVLAIVLSFVFGYGLTMQPLLAAGLPFPGAARTAMASDTASIVAMEATDNLVVLAVPGAMTAGLADPLFWGSLGVSLLVAFAVAFPVNRWLIARGLGHALVHHEHH